MDLPLTDESVAFLITALTAHSVAGNSAKAGKASSNNAGDITGVLSSAEIFSDAVDAVRKSIVAKLMDIFMIEETEIDPK